MCGDAIVRGAVKDIIDVVDVLIDAFGGSPVGEHNFHIRAMDFSKQFHVFPLAIGLEIQLIESLQMGLNLVALFRVRLCGWGDVCQS
jgi:hypothetical protein